ncbi:MAG TPA: 5-oxoprolinase subunit PxpA [Flavisolibacter sp.]|nr:5-oxoprolinase subunit PxpA [Flavisolibacter sp.]
MLICDLNCDMGEGMPNDAALMPFISSANIACGYHAGDEDTMKKTVALCLEYGVAIGAHPSYADRENFGRKEMPVDADEVYVLIEEQLAALQKITKEFRTTITHVKPHGTLYSAAAKDKNIAAAIASAVREFDEDLELFGLSGSYSISEAKALGLKTRNEVFADRTYQDDGSLTPRSLPNALIEDENKVVQQVLQMIEKGTVTTVSGKEVPIEVETICIHGDGRNAVALAKRLSSVLRR